ncbi:MAG: hypothetical protein ACLSDO_01570 [Anaerotruncus colihominis]
MRINISRAGTARARYVDEPIQIVYERADYSMTYLRQVRQDIIDELVRQGFSSS